MNKPDVSIIVPCYNVEKYLVECLESLVTQSAYADTEIICINDGSTDKTLDILQDFSLLHDRVNLISQSNKGLSEARNAGLRVASGEYVMFVDSDDTISERMVELGLNAFRTYNIDCVNFKMKAYPDFDADEKALSDIKGLNDWLSNKYQGVQYFDFDKAYTTNANVCNKMYRLSDIKGKIEFVPNLLYEDIYFSWRMFFNTKVMYYTDEVQYNYRIRPNSIMTNTEKEKDYYKAMHHFYNWEELIRDLSYDKYTFLNNRDNLLRLLDKYTWQVKYYSPDDKKDEIQDYSDKLREWFLEIYNNYKKMEV